MPPTTVFLAMDATNSHTEARRGLEHAGFAVLRTTFEIPAKEAAPVAAIVVDSSGAVPQASEFCRRWRERRGTSTIPLIWLADLPEGRMAGWQAGADAVLGRPLAFGELAAQLERLKAQSEERQRLAARAGESTEINQSLLRVYQQHDADFRIARLIQQLCRPSELPEVGRARFAVSQRELLGSAGDFHNVWRIDEDNVAFFLGDVMGQSLTACMLAVFIHQSVSPKQIVGQSYRVVPPKEVMRQLSHSLALLQLPEPPLIRLTYGLLNCQTGDLNFACAGHTPPVYLPATGPAELRRASGPLLAPDDAHHEAQQFRLRPGDRVLLFTDGLPSPAPEPFANLLHAAETHRALPLPSLMATITQDLVGQSREPDDFTLLGVEFR